jgi:hypothetical protein
LGDGAAVHLLEDISKDIELRLPDFVKGVSLLTTRNKGQRQRRRRRREVEGGVKET